MSLTRRSLAGLVVVASLVLLGVGIGLWSNSDGARPATPQPAEPGVETRADLAVPLETEDASARTSIDPEPGSGATAGSVTPAPDLELEIVDELGSVVTETPVLLLDAHGGIQTGRTDSRGRVGFAARPGRCALFVRPAAGAPRREEIDASAGDRTIRLAPMEELSGVVREECLPPADPLKLMLFSDARLFQAELPEDVGTFLGFTDDGRYRSQQSIAADGTFSFRGLPAAWSGRLILPETWAVAEGKRGRFGPRLILVGAPARNMVIDVEHLPHLAGRVVDVHGEPVEGARIHGALTWGDRRSSHLSVESGPDGRFELRLDQSDLVQVKLDVRGPGGAGSAVLERHRNQLGADLDVGDIVLAPGATLRLHVTDVDGRPLAGAVAEVGGKREKPISDVQGNCTLADVPADAEVVSVHARGYWTEHLTLPLPGADPVTVVMKPCNRLTVQVQGSGRQPPGKVRLRISAGSHRLFPDTRSSSYGPIVPGRLVGTSLGTRYDGSGHGEAMFATDEAGTLSIEGIVPDVPIRIRAIDATGTLAGESEFRPLGIAEDRHEELHVALASRGIAGEVRDEAGTPVPKVRVELRAGKRDAAYAVSDEHGRFRFDALYATAVDLHAQKEGFARVRLKDVRLIQPVESIVITLVRGRQATVSVVDARSRPVAGGQLTVMDQDIMTGWPARELGPGLYRIVDLPAHDVTLQLHLAGRQYETRHDPHVPEARIEVPVHGRIVVTWSTDQPGRHSIQVKRLDGPLDTLVSATSDKPDSEAVFENVLPGKYEVTLVPATPAKAGATVPSSSTIVVEADVTRHVTLRP